VGWDFLTEETSERWGSASERNLTELLKVPLQKNVEGTLMRKKGDPEQIWGANFTFIGRKVDSRIARERSD